jgi:hypothetical protein
MKSENSRSFVLYKNIENIANIASPAPILSRTLSANDGE